MRNDAIFDGIRPRQLLGVQGFLQYLTINLAALRRNFGRFASMVRSASVVGVVKADCYGLGPLPVARSLFKAGLPSLFVTYTEEAISLRPDLPTVAKVFVLNGPLPGVETAWALAELIPALNSFHAVSLLARTGAVRGRRLPAVVELILACRDLDSCPPRGGALRAEAVHSPELEIPYVMSHLASADEPAKPRNAGFGPRYNRPQISCNSRPSVPKSLLLKRSPYRDRHLKVGLNQ